ncbi:MAG TPA: tetratricopeptide repeat protein [Terriglobales bacterium]|nr:tetratricopeptide repeat protein [Terriglobales bacterium]
MDKESKETSSIQVPSRKFNLLIATFCGVLILAHFISSFFPKNRLWGINQLAYFPLWVKLIFTIAGLLILVPWLNSRICRILEQILSFFQRIFVKKEIIGYLFFTLISMFFFWLLRTRTNFLGDGYAYISQLSLEKFHRIGYEPLEVFTHLYLYKLLKLFFSPSAEFLYAGLSILAGGIFVYLLFHLARAVSEDKFDRLFIFSLILFSGATELFLGYVEHYTLTYVSIFAYLYFSLRYLQGKIRIFLPVFFCVLSICFHLAAAYLLPSLFFLFALKKGNEEKIFSFKKGLPYLLILIFFLGIAGYYIHSVNPVLLQIFVPLLKGKPDAPAYTLLSPAHLIDILDQHLIISSSGLVLMLGLGIVCRKIIKRKDSIAIFLIIVTVAQLLYHLLVDPALGAGRDWDLFSAVGLGYTLLGIYLFLSFVQPRKYSALVLSSTALLLILPWFLLNANVGKSTERFKNLLDLDLKKSLMGRYALIDYYNQLGRPGEAENVRAEIYHLFPDDSLIHIASPYIAAGDYIRAEQLLNQAIGINPNSMGAYHTLGVLYLLQGKTDRAIGLFQKVIRLNPFYSPARVNLGQALLSKGNLKEALAQLEKAEKLGAIAPTLYSDIAYINFKLGKTEKSIKNYRKAIELDPKSYLAHYELGQVYFQRDSLDQALTEFDQAVDLKPDFAPLYLYLGLVYERKGLKEKAIEELDLFLKYSQDEVRNQEVRNQIQQLRSQKP